MDSQKDFIGQKLEMGDIVICIFIDEDAAMTYEPKLRFGIVSLQDSNGWTNIDIINEQEHEFYTPYNIKEVWKIPLEAIPQPDREAFAKYSKEITG